MAVFFLDWDLWQEMTFVLACCILVVFCIGFAKLWKTNRELRKHEVIDEEKRARVLEMRHCGIDAWGANEIPFGVRAIQSGIEVDGIWISQPSPNFSRIRSSTTLIGDQSEITRAKAVWPDRSSDRPRRSRYASENSTIDQMMSEDSLLPPNSPTLAGHDSSARFSDNATHLSEQRPRPAPQVSSYIPTGLHENHERDEPAEPYASSSSSASSSGPEGRVTEGVRQPTGDSLPYGTAEVFVNRNSRRANRFFEVLPAGILGPRQELSGPSRNEFADAAASERQPKRRNKLRKNPPFNHGR